MIFKKKSICWRRSFSRFSLHDFLAYHRAEQRQRNIGLSTVRLNSEGIWPSSRSVGSRQLLEPNLQNRSPQVRSSGKNLAQKLGAFLHWDAQLSVFLIRIALPHQLQIKNRATSLPRVRVYPFNMLKYPIVILMRCYYDRLTPHHIEVRVSMTTAYIYFSYVLNHSLDAAHSLNSLSNVWDMPMGSMVRSINVTSINKRRVYEPAHSFNIFSGTWKRARITNYMIQL